MAIAPGWIGGSPCLPTITCGQARVVVTRNANSSGVVGADWA